MALEAFDSTPVQLLTPDEAKLQLREMELAAMVVQALEIEYPGHMWAASVQGGAVIVRNLALEGQWGFVLHAHLLVNEDLPKRVRAAGGELLERFRISRTRAGVAQAADYLHQRMSSAVLSLPSWAR